MKQPATATDPALQALLGAAPAPRWWRRPRTSWIRVPRVLESSHFLVLGATGTGKSALIRELLEMLGEEIDELGIAKQIEPIHRMLEVGTSADRQLRVFDANDGDLKAVVQHLIAETKEGL